MKKIEMDYSEYEGLISLVKTQQNIIDKFKKCDNVVIVDDRYDYSPEKHNLFASCVPKIYGNNAEAKKILKEEFDILHERTERLEKELNELRDEKYKKKKWWK